MLNFCLLIVSTLIALLGLLVAGVYVFTFWLALLLINVIFLASVAIVDDVLPLGDFSFFVILLNTIAFVVQVVDCIFFKRKDRKVMLLLSKKESPKLTSSIMAVFLYLTALVFYKLSLGDTSALDSNWIEIAAARSALQIVFINISVLFFLLFLCFIFDIYIKGKSGWCLVVLACAGLLYAALFKAKSILLPVFVPIFVIWFFFSDGYKYQKIIKLSLLAVPVYFVYHSIAAFRWVGGLANLSFESFFSAFGSSLSVGFEPALTYQSTGIFRSFYDSGDYLLAGGAYTKFLLIPVTYLFDIHIENPMYTYFYILGGEDGAIRGSVHPSLYSDAFATFGWFGVFMGGIWIVFLRGMYELFTTVSKSLFAVYLVAAAYSIPLLARGSVYYAILYLVIGGVLLAGLYLLFKQIVNLAICFVRYFRIKNIAS